MHAVCVLLEEVLHDELVVVQVSVWQVAGGEDDDVINTVLAVTCRGQQREGESDIRRSEDGQEVRGSEVRGHYLRGTAP